MSPATKTPGTFVIHCASRFTLPRAVSSTPELARRGPCRSAPVKPIASSTRSAFSSNSVPATGSNVIRPFSDRLLDLHALQRRARGPRRRRRTRSSTPSRAARRLPRAPTRRGRSAATAATGCRPRASSGGLGSSSSWCTDFGALAMRGAEAVGAGVAAADDDDVLAFAEMNCSSATASPSQRWFCCGRYSIAKWMPLSSRPGIGRSRPTGAPHARTTASNVALQRRRVRRRRRRRSPAGTRRPPAPSCARRRSRTAFSILNSGMP